jgi:hypothetical protein
MFLLLLLQMLLVRQGKKEAGPSRFAGHLQFRLQQLFLLLLLHLSHLR